MEEPHQLSRWAAAKRADPPDIYPTLTGQPAPSNKQPRSGSSAHGSLLCQGMGVGCRSAGPGSDLSEESATGAGLAAMDFRVAPGCPPGPASCIALASATSCRKTAWDSRLLRQRRASIGVLPAVPLLLAGGGVYGGGAGPGREVGLGLEPGDIADVTEDPGGTDRTDAVKVGQSAAGRRDRLGQAPVVDADRGQAGCAHGDDRDRVRVGGVGLAAMAG